MISYEIEQFSHFVRSTFGRKVSSIWIYFDNPHYLDDSDYKILTGLSKNRFEDLTYYGNFIRNIPSRSARTSIAIFLSTDCR